MHNNLGNDFVIFMVKTQIMVYIIAKKEKKLRNNGSRKNKVHKTHYLYMSAAT
jgi:hypothetical protein